MTGAVSPHRRINRRRVLSTSVAAGVGIVAGGRLARPAGSSARTRLSVLSPLPPDPAPPGAGTFGEEALGTWEEDNDTDVSYEQLRWPDLHDTLATDFDSGADRHDLNYMSSWIPEFSDYLVPLDNVIPAGLRADLPPSAFNTATWNGQIFGVVYTLSLLTLFYNKEHLDLAGITRPPKTWDDLKGYAAELTRADEQYGWVLNYGAPSGIGGVASYWMAFLQQAGGAMYGADGLPAFNAQPGVDALQLMIDLMPFTAPDSLHYVGIYDATGELKRGRASMMMNWPFMWKDAQDPASSQISGRLASAILPAGPAGSASIDGSDAWTIAAASRHPQTSMKLIEFYLDPEIQKRQVLDTGWLPIRLSTLADPEVQQAATNAAVVLEQAQFPYDSFVTPDYDEVTDALGVEIQQALRGEKTAAIAMADASATVTSIVRRRLRS